MVPDGAGKAFRIQREVLLLRKIKAFCCASDAPERFFIFAESRRRNQRPARPQDTADPPDQVCRTVSADDIICRNTVMHGKTLPQQPAFRIRIAGSIFQRADGGVARAARQPERADIRRKVQRHCSVLFPVSGPVAAVLLFHPNLISPIRIKASRPRHSQLPASSNRQALRISSGSTGRSSSPIYGLLCGTPK